MAQGPRERSRGRVPTDSRGRPRRRTNTEVIIQSVKDKLGIGSGARGRQVDRRVDEVVEGVRIRRRD